MKDNPWKPATVLVVLTMIVPNLAILLAGCRPEATPTPVPVKPTATPAPSPALTPSLPVASFLYQLQNMDLEATGQTGYACALAWLMFGVVFVFVMIQMKVFRSRQIYD